MEREDVAHAQPELVLACVCVCAYVRSGAGGLCVQ